MNVVITVAVCKSDHHHTGPLVTQELRWASHCVVEDGTLESGVMKIRSVQEVKIRVVQRSLVIAGLGEVTEIVKIEAKKGFESKVENIKIERFTDQKLMQDNKHTTKQNIRVWPQSCHVGKIKRKGNGSLDE